MMLFAVGCHLGWKDGVQLAARASLHFATSDFPLVDEMKLDSTNIWQFKSLLDFHSRSAEAASAVASTKKTSYPWIPIRHQRFRMMGAVSRCECLSTESAIYFSDGQYATTRKYWVDYMNEAAKALKSQPIGSVVAEDRVMEVALAKAFKCSQCASTIFAELREFSDVLGKEVDRVVSEVSPQTSPNGQHLILALVKVEFTI
jgi:hypothetical protein